MHIFSRLRDVNILTLTLLLNHLSSFYLSMFLPKPFCCGALQIDGGLSANMTGRLFAEK